MTITRTITLDDITPKDLAELFTDMDSFRQAEFFAEVWEIARSWPGAGWCEQSCAIVEKLSREGEQAIEALAEHLALAREQGK